MSPLVNRIFEFGEEVVVHEQHDERDWKDGRNVVPILDIVRENLPQLLATHFTCLLHTLEK